IMGVFGHATHFVVLLSLTGLLVLFRAIGSSRIAGFVCAGILLGMSVLMKQNGIFFLAFGIAVAMWSDLRQPHRNPRRAVWVFALLFMSSTVPFLIMILLFLAQGVLPAFWFWTFQYAKEYVTQIPLWESVFYFAGQLISITRANYAIWLL